MTSVAALGALEEDEFELVEAPPKEAPPVVKKLDEAPTAAEAPDSPPAAAGAASDGTTSPY